MFLRKKDREREVWEGWRVGVEGAKERLGLRRGVPHRGARRSSCPKLLEGRSRLVYALGSTRTWTAQSIRTLREARAAGAEGQARPAR